MVDDVYLIQDVLEVSSLSGVSTGFVRLDQVMAFDRVERSFLWETMEKFGIRDGFIAPKIRVLYSDIESVLKTNGSLCAPFRVHRGVQQGCALSGMLDALSLEPLLQKIRQNVEGLFLPAFLNLNMVLSAYADDVVVFIRNQRDVNTLGTVTQKFSVVSSANVN